MLARFHNQSSIYLYCTVENNIAQEIINKNIYNKPLKLYETAAISNAMAVNIQNPVTIRIAVNLSLNANEYYYDELTMLNKQIIQKYKLKSIEEYKSRCVYTRCLVVEDKTKLKVIEYTVFKANKLSCPHYAEII